MIKAMVADQNPNHGRDGFYLASSGSVAWHDIYVAMARALKKRGVIASDEVAHFTDEALAKYAEAQGVDLPSVKVKIAGRYVFASANVSVLEALRLTLQGVLSKQSKANSSVGRRYILLPIFSKPWTTRWS